MLFTNAAKTAYLVTDDIFKVIALAIKPQRKKKKKFQILESLSKAAFYNALYFPTVKVDIGETKDGTRF